MRKEELSKSARKRVSSLGGKSRARNLTSSERTAQASVAATARWAKEEPEESLGLEQTIRARLLDLRVAVENCFKQIEGQLPAIRKIEALLREFIPESGGSLTTKGFREALRTVMGTHVGGIGGAQLARELEAGGFRLPLESKKPLAARVYIELHKMSKTGEVTRKEGKYFLEERNQKS